MSWLIIDEQSQLSQVMLGKIESRLKQIKACNQTCGGISVLLCGDYGQLMPVFGSPLYDKKTNNSTMGILGHEVYKQFIQVVQLHKCIRQVKVDKDNAQDK